MKLKKFIWVLVIGLVILPINAFANDSTNNDSETNEPETNEPGNTDVDENVEEIHLNKEDLERNFTYYFNSATRRARDDEDNRLYKIYIPEGIYNSDDQLKVYKNIHIFMDNVTIVNNSNYGLIRLGDKSTYDTANEGAGFPEYGIYSNITIEGGTLDNNDFNGAIIRMGHASNITLKNITFKNVTNAHFVEFGAVKDVLVDGCTFQDFKGDFDSKTNYEALQIDALSHDHFGAFNPDNDETPSINVTITNNTFKNLQRGVGTHTGIVNSYFDNFKINNNTFENITGYAIMATNYTNSLIDSNTMTNVGAGIMMRSVENAHKNFYASNYHNNSRDKYYFLNNVISNNIINVTRGYKAEYSNVSYGIQLYGEYLEKANGTVPKGDFRLSGVWVNDNTINLNTVGYGIWLQGAIKNALNRNKININILTNKKSGGNGDGIRILNGTNITVNGNIVRNYTTSGLDGKLNGLTANEGSKEIKAYYNEFYISRKHGIYLENTKNNIISGNYLYKSYKDGISLYNTKGTTITNNNINITARDGIRLDKSKNNTITKNAVKTANDDGIDLLSGSNNNKVAGNNINTVKYNGVYNISSNENVFDSNKIYTAKKESGIYVKNSKKIKVVKNTIKGCKKYGVYGSKKMVTKFSKNTISKCNKGKKNW